jgi:hypothetical protein
MGCHVERTSICRGVLRCAVAVGLFALGAAGPAAADDAFVDFISPISNPVNFEDPRPTTELRPLYAYHRVSDGFANEVGANGGDAHVVALQIRVALSERFALIATKDGYVWHRPDDELSGVYEKKNGWANIGFGVKYAFYRDPERGAMATFGLRYEAPSGDKDVFQGRGDGVLNPFLSGLWGIGDLHLLGYTATRVPISGNDSTFFDLSLHADYRVSDVYRFYPVVEMNWIHTLDGGRRLPIDEEGFDFFNFGSKRAGGKGVVTFAVGARYRLFEGVETRLGRTLRDDIGATYEFPMTDRQDIFGWRVTTDLILWLG